MPKIEDSDKQLIQNMFSEKMNGTAHIRFFSTKENCQYCADTQDILEQLKGLTDKIDLQILDKDEHAEEASRLGVDKVPAIVFVEEDGTDTGVRFYGVPSGYEFSTLIEDIIDVANHETELTPETVEALKQIEDDVTISVYVTPT